MRSVLLAAELTRLLDRIADLEVENRELRLALVPQIELPGIWRLSAQEAQLVRCLYAARGHKPAARLAFALSRTDEPLNEGHLRTIVSNARDKMAFARRGTIECVRGAGYALDAVARRLVDDCLDRDERRAA